MTQMSGYALSNRWKHYQPLSIGIMIAKPIGDGLCGLWWEGHVVPGGFDMMGLVGRRWWALWPKVGRQWAWSPWWLDDKLDGCGGQEMMCVVGER